LIGLSEVIAAKRLFAAFYIDQGSHDFLTPTAGGKRCYGASGEDKASSSLDTTDGVPHAAAE
jgi:hypothetical protein